MKTESLTFLRFIAALIVVVFHYGRNTDLPSFGINIFMSGPEMVTFFFVLSGFVMLISYYHKSNESFRSYLVARVARIFPVYLLALGAVLLIASGSVIEVFLSASLMQAWISPYPTSLNTPGWSLSVEMFFYLTFPLTVFLIKKYSISGVKLIFLSLMVYFLTQIILSRLMMPGFYNGYPSFSHDIIYYFPLSHYCSFLTGVTCGVIYIRNKGLFHKKGLVEGMVFFGVVFLIYYLFQNPWLLRNLVGYPIAYGSSFYCVFFAVFILGFLYSKNFITKIMALPAMIFMGEISYSIYILQKPIFVVYNEYIGGVIDVDENFNFIFYFLFLMLVSSLTYLLIEKPCKKWVLNFNEKLLKVNFIRSV